MKYPHYQVIRIWVSSIGSVEWEKGPFLHCRKEAERQSREALKKDHLAVLIYGIDKRWIHHLLKHEASYGNEAKKEAKSGPVT